MAILHLTNLLLFLLISILIWFLIGLKWYSFSNFFHTRYSYFEISFILLYFVEQLILSYFIYMNYNAQVIAGIFSIIIITTAAVQNKCWESRTQKINEASVRQRNLISSIKTDNERLAHENKILNHKLSEVTEFTEKLFLDLENTEKEIKLLKKKR